MAFELGSEQVEAVNAVSGDRCNPHPHVFSDRLIRPGDQAFFDIIHSFMGYRTCYYRTFCVGSASASQVDAYRQCRQWLDDAIALVRPGCDDGQDRRGLADGAGARVPERGVVFRPAIRPRPRRRALRGADDLAPALLRRPGRDRGGHGASRSRPTARQRDGRSAARIEEEVLVTADGCEILTRFPAEELLVCGRTVRPGRRHRRARVPLP